MGRMGKDVGTKVVKGNRAERNQLEIINEYRGNRSLFAPSDMAWLPPFDCLRLISRAGTVFELFSENTLLNLNRRLRNYR